ncbi:MAG: hypothetical protein QMD36_01275 [Candidatus Aenigmarchaeota archaeon]|nr:hypothetical protein [Candidatus Aenigmarchaeota archaeon]
MPFPTERSFALEKRISWYETLCNNLGSYFFEVPVGKATIKDLSEKLEFCDLRITPNSVYATAIMIIVIGILVGSLFFIFNLATYGLLAITASVGFSIYILYYPSILTRYYRIQASSELVMSVLYMVVSLRLTPSLEKAVMFATENLSGPLGKDLKRMMWGLSTGEYLNVEELLDELASKWRKENLEFYQAIDMIKTSMMEKGEKRERTLDESINVLLRGNMVRMKNYTTQLKMPLIMITTFGVTLPILTVIMFPIMTIFLTETIKPMMLVLSYNIILPMIVYFLMGDVLRSMPLQFRTVDISLHPDAHPIGKYFIKFKGRRIKVPLLPVAILIGASMIGLGVLIVSLSGKEAITLVKLCGGLTVLWGIASMLAFYSFFSYYKNIEIKDEIKETESSLDEAIFQLGHILYTGKPVETSLEKLSNSMRGLRIESMFTRALSNIRRFGFTLRKAFFDEKVGVVKYYPSMMIRNILEIIVDFMEKGVIGTAKTMISIAQYLKSVDRVEEYSKEIMEETTSDMRFTLSLMTPITCGIVVGMATIMVMILAKIVFLLSSVTGLSSTLPQLQSSSFIESIVDVKKIVPAEVFLVIVGTYMLEVVILLSIFLSSLEYGGDPLEKYKLITNGTMLGMVIFSFSILMIYLIFGGIIKMVWPT